MVVGRDSMLVVVLCLPLIFNPVARAGALTGGATEWTQIANNGLLVSNLSQIILQTQQVIQNGQHLLTQVQDMAVQAESLANLDFDDFLNHIAGLDNILQQGRALSFTSMASEQSFRQQFSSYAEYLTNNTEFSQQYFEDKYSEWHDSLNSSIEGTLRLHNITYDKIQSEEGRLQLIEARASTATGRNQLLKVASDISMMANESLRNLLTIQMQHSQVHSQYMAFETNKAQMQQARKQQFMTQGELPILGDGADW